LDRVRLLLDQLHGNAFGLRQKWTLYQELYGDQKRVEVMQATAFVTFGILQPALWESIFMGITRFIDPAKSMGNETASLEQLLKAIPPGHDGLCADLTSRLATLRTNCEPIRQWRHNRIAHANLAVVMMEKILDSPTIQGVHRAIGGIEDFHRQVGNHFYPSETWSFAGEVDADRMMFLIAEGLKLHPSSPPFSATCARLPT
jgi:HEPN superfamily AbiU2-like protein